MSAPTIEDRVRERMERERGDLTEKYLTLNAERDEAHEKYASALAGLTELAERALSAHADNLLVGGDLKGELADAFVAAQKALAGAIKRGNDKVAAQQSLERLADDAEFARRVEEASRLAADRASGRRPSGRTAAIRILLDAGRPLHYREITSKALETGLLTPKADAKTPEATMNAMLAVAAKKDDTFVKVAPGVFGLIDADVARAALTTPAADEPTDDAPAPDAPAPVEQPAANGAPKRDRSAAAKKAAETRKRNREAAGQAT